MATELVTFKMEKSILQDVDRTVKSAGYHTRTEFIRAALREKVDEAKLKQVMAEIRKTKGKAKRQTTDEERARTRQEVFEEMLREFNIK